MANHNQAATVAIMLAACCTGVFAASPNATPSADTEAIEIELSPSTAKVIAVFTPREKLVDRNAVPLYEEAVRAVPADLPSGSPWLTDDPADLPVEKAAEIAKSGAAALAKVREAARCARCEWEEPPSFKQLADYRNLSRLIVLDTRLQIARKDYPQLAQDLQAGYALARALGGKGTKLVHGMVGVVVARCMNEQVFWLVQQPGAPTLSLADMPTPLVDLAGEIEAETTAAKSAAPNAAVYRQLQQVAKPAYDRAEADGVRVDCELAVLRILVGLRDHAAAHAGTLPKTLAGITPKPSTSRPAGNESSIRYTATGTVRARINVKLPPASRQPRLQYDVTIQSVEKIAPKH